MSKPRSTKSAEAKDGSAKKRPRRKRGSLSREEIIQAARSVLQEEGLDQLSMRRISDRLECSIASPYAYFEGIDAIIRILILEGERELTDMLKKARAQSDEVFQQLKDIAHTYWSFSTSNRELHKLMFNGSVSLHRQAFPTLPTAYRVFLDTIRRGIQRGDIRFHRSRYRAVARTMWAWIYGIIVLEMSDVLRTGHSTAPLEEGIELFSILLKTGDTDVGV